MQDLNSLSLRFTRLGRLLAAVVLIAGLGLGLASTAQAQVQQTGDCSASCAAVIDDPMGDIVTNDAVNFKFFGNNQSEQQPIDGVGFVDAQLTCDLVTDVGDVGAAGTCCVRIACATGLNCAQTALAGFQLAGTFTGTTCTPSAGLACNVLDDNTVCLSGTTVLPDDTLVELLSVDSTATNPVNSDLDGNGSVGDFSSGLNTLNNFLVDVTIDAVCTEDTGLTDNGSCQTTETANYPPVCDVQLDKQVSCDGGVTFVDIGFADGVAESCDGWNPFGGNPGEQIIVRYVAEPGAAADLDLSSCVIDESNKGIADTINVGVIAIGGSFNSPNDDDQVCSDVLAGAEPDTATIDCECVTGAGPNLLASDTDMADFECLDPSLNVSKQCIDTGIDGAGDQAVIDVANDGTADLVDCQLTDTLDTNEPSASCPGDGFDLEVDVSVPPFDLAANTMNNGITIDFGNRLTPSCNTASVTCTIDGTQKTITEEDAFACEPLICDVRLDKVVIVDGVRIDEGDFAVRVLGQGISWGGFDTQPPDDVDFEFIVENLGTADTECVVVDTLASGVERVNQVITVPAGGMQTVTATSACTADIAGVDTATVVCTCIDDVGFEVEVSDEDSAEVLCLVPGLNVVKECLDDDPINSLDDTVSINVTNTGDAELVNCQVTDSLDLDATCPSGANDLPVVVAPQGFALPVGGLGQLVTGTFAELDADACNNVSVTCTIEGTAKAVTATDDEPCTGGVCQVAFDKQVTCDGLTFADIESATDPGNAATQGCTSWNPHDSNGDGANDAPGEAASRRFIIDNNVGGSATVECSISDSDGGGITAYGPFTLAPGDTEVVNAPGVCDPGDPGISGIDTATLSCSCLDVTGAPSGQQIMEVTPFVDLAQITCETPVLDVTKVCDEQANDSNAITITIENNGDTNLENCSVSDPIAPDCDAQAVTTPILPGDDDTVLCSVDGLAVETLNEVTVTCDIAGTTKQLSDSAEDICEVVGQGCISRTPGFYCNRHLATNHLLPIEVCGITLDNVDDETQGSALENLPGPGRDGKLSSPQALQLQRQCTAATLNLKASDILEANCDSEIAGITARVEECCSNAMCTADKSAINASGCIGDLDDFNNSNFDGNELQFTGAPDFPSSIDQQERGWFPPGPAGKKGDTCSGLQGNGFINDLN